MIFYWLIAFNFGVNNLNLYFMKMKKSQCYYWKDKLDGEDNEWFEFTDDSFTREAYDVIESRAIDNTYNKGNS